MPTKGRKKGLGRGFESLIPTELLDESFDPTAEQDGKVSQLRSVKIDQVVPDPDQPRRQFDDMSLAELAASVREHGILQPLVVTPYKGRFMIVAGERRFRAAVMAGLSKLPVLVRTLTNQHKLEISLIENLQRRDLNPVETAMAYLKLRDQFNLTLDKIGERVGGKATSSISNTLRILRLPDDAKMALAKGEITEGQARPLIGLEPDVISQILPKIIENGWSARAIEQYVSKIKQSQSGASEGDQPPQFVRETERISKKLGAKVQIKPTSKGSGRIVISYKNTQELEQLVGKIVR